jgi:uncharacterized damage-inducible protein DinB
MDSDEAMKTVLRNSLKRTRETLMWKLEGLSERELRWPRTPTGFNLLGVVKHMANVETGYFGDTFDRPWPHRDEVVFDEVFENDPQADWYATEAESAEDVLDLYRRVWAFADETFDSLPLDSPGKVPHWPAPMNAVTLGQIMVHVLVDLTRHLGQVDVVREGIDGQVGLSAASPNIPESQDWEAYSAMLRELAEKTGR